MTINEIIGWLATAITMLSFAVNKMLLLRSLNLIACLVWITYGFLEQTNPIIVTNAVIACIHLVWFFKSYREKPKNKSSES
jgi:hypothetical protein